MSKYTVDDNGGQLEYSSGTSNSSVVNVDDADHSYSNSNFTYSFDILKPINREDDHDLRSPIVVTKQLFPEINTNRDLRHYQWLNVGGGGVVGERDFKLMQNQQQNQLKQQVRKSRRGPTPRSSQYRGVTFYRKTGRWESHIWLVDYYTFYNQFCTETVISCTNLMFRS